MPCIGEGRIGPGDGMDRLAVGQSFDQIPEEMPDLERKDSEDS
jgi:uncharacterized protein (DUF433 family)